MQKSLLNLKFQRTIITALGMVLQIAPLKCLYGKLKVCLFENAQQQYQQSRQFHRVHQQYNNDAMLIRFASDIFCIQLVISKCVSSFDVKKIQTNKNKSIANIRNTMSGPYYTANNKIAAAIFLLH